MSSNKRTSAIIISAVLALSIYISLLFGWSQPGSEQSMIISLLGIGIIVCLVTGYKIPAHVTLSALDFWFVVFPLAFILLLFGLIHTYENIMIEAQVPEFEPIDKFFKIGLGIALMVSVGALMVQINANRRLRKLEKVVGNNEISLVDLIKNEIKLQLDEKSSKLKEKTDNL